MTRRSWLESLAVTAVVRPRPLSRRFTLGLYDPPKGGADPLREAASAGFDLVHAGATRAELDRVQAAGLEAWVTVGSIAASTRDRDAARIRALVTELKDHPALRFWETEDEPSYQWKKPGPRVPPEQIIETARVIRSVDPKRPLYLNHAPTNLVSTLRQYNQASDIVAMDIYPVIPHGIREEYALWPDGQQGDLLDTSLSQVGAYTRKMRQVAGPERQVFLVLQAFAWEMLRDKDRDPAMIRYPNREELRSMAWAAIANGADGLLFWGLASTPGDAPLWPALKAVAEELQQHRKALSEPPTKLALRLEYHDTGHSLDRGIEWIARGGQLITVNADKNPVEVTFQLPKRSFRESYKPFEARIYPLAI